MLDGKRRRPFGMPATENVSLPVVESAEQKVRGRIEHRVPRHGTARLHVDEAFIDQCREDVGDRALVEV